MEFLDKVRKHNVHFFLFQVVEAHADEEVALFILQSLLQEPLRASLPVGSLLIFDNT